MWGSGHYEYREILGFIITHIASYWVIEAEARAGVTGGESQGTWTGIKQTIHAAQKYMKLH